MSIRQKVEEFYVHRVHDPERVDTNLTPITQLLSAPQKPTVIHFYNGGWGGCRPCAAQMEKWAKSIPHVQFLCICVESTRVAVAFHYMFQFQHALNAYFPPEAYDGLDYGQLGCSGFIVIDKDGYFVSKQTKAFLDYGEMAFVDVESILAGLVDEDIPSSFQNGSSANASNGNSATVTVASTGIDAMDEEHTECTDCINSALEKPTKENLAQLHNILTSHFEHEEELMKHYFDQEMKNETLSSSTVELHMRDHQRILKVARKELDRISPGGNSCSIKGQWQQSAVDLAVIRKISVGFRVHAEQFDKLYEGIIPTHAQ